MIFGFVIGAVLAVLVGVFWFRKKTPVLPSGLETSMLKSDFGASTTQALLEKAQTQEALKEEVKKILSAPVSTGLTQKETPTVILFVGVNGVGKTTSIGKIAALLAKEGKRVILGAGDTFRAAAEEQLGIWAERTGSCLVSKHGGDPAAVLFDAVSKAKQENYDFVLCDTAGRLHTKDNLMEELKKVHRVLGKAMPGAPHEVFLVLDGTTGQNALSQAREFMLASPITGIVLTKLDGTAKGGIVVAITKEFQIPIKFIGVGERAEDLKPFDANEFTEALFEN
ncbi:MAG: signal recognition particle-docking protein FtsY [Myxococcaceae bacterium]